MCQRCYQYSAPSVVAGTSRIVFHRLNFEDHRPTESGLRPFQHQKLKMFAVIMDWHTPFAIVIPEHQGIVHADPATSFGGHRLPTLLQGCEESLC